MGTDSEYPESVQGAEGDFSSSDPFIEQDTDCQPYWPSGLMAQEDTKMALLCDTVVIYVPFESHDTDKCSHWGTKDMLDC